MTAAKKMDLASVEDYLAREELADEKSEYVGGYVYAMGRGAQRPQSGRHAAPG